jgi:hypothetical protein
VFKATLVALTLTLSAPALPHAQEQAPDAQRRRKQIQLMEGVLAQAGAVAAETMGNRLRKIEPGMTVTFGLSRARGFVLDGYGIFFDVEVPALAGTLVWSQMVLQRELTIANALEMLKRALANMPEGPSLKEAQQAVNVLHRQTGPVSQVRGAQPVSGEVKAAEAVAVMRDPNEEYKHEVKQEIIEAVLHHSLQLNMGADEWLAVAAHVSEAQQTQRGVTLMIRVKGSDLALFAADPTRRDEIRARVQVKEF